MIIIDENGNITAKKEYLPLFQRKRSKNFDHFDQCSSDDDSLDDVDEDSELIITPEK